jgi:hypothetical protein
MKKLFSVITAIIAVTLFGADADATTKMKCGCLEVTKSKVDGQTISTDNGKISLSCNTKDKYSKTGKSVSVQETYLKVYVDSSNTVQGDSDMNIRFRPRSTTLVSVADGQTKKILWTGVKDDKSYQDIGQFKIKNDAAAFSATTAKKSYIGLVMFADLGDKKSSMIALCLENK